jgi:hypothetical protein
VLEDVTILMVPEYQMSGGFHRYRHSHPRLGNGRWRASTGAWMCFKDIVITIVVCLLTQSFTVAVGVEVVGAQPLVVVWIGVQLHAYHGSSLLSGLCFRFFNFIRQRDVCAKLCLENMYLYYLALRAT